jgi:hypothetical protein
VEFLVDVMSAELDQLCPAHWITGREALIQIVTSYATVKIKCIIHCDESPLPFRDQSRTSTRRKFQAWSSTEDIRLLAGIYRFGLQNWCTICRFVGNGRTRTQCGQRWTRSLNPKIQKDVWTRAEELALMTYVNQFGEKSWSRVAALIGSRSDVQCRYHYRRITKSARDPEPVVLTPPVINSEQIGRNTSSRPSRRVGERFMLSPIESFLNRLKP